MAQVAAQDGYTPMIVVSHDGVQQLPPADARQKRDAAIRWRVGAALNGEPVHDDVIRGDVQRAGCTGCHTVDDRFGGTGRAVPWIDAEIVALERERLVDRHVLGVDAWANVDRRAGAAASCATP